MPPPLPFFSPLQQYVPLFLCKEDLDVAVQSAYRQRNAAQIKMYCDKAEKLEEDYAQVGPVQCMYLHGFLGLFRFSVWDFGGSLTLFNWLDVSDRSTGAAPGWLVVRRFRDISIDRLISRLFYAFGRNGENFTGPAVTNQ